MASFDVTNLLNREIALTFVQLVTAQDDPIIRVRILHDKDKLRPKGEQSGTVAKLWPSILGAQADGLGVFWLPNLCNFQGEAFARDTDATAFPALFCDFDHGFPTEWHRQPDIIVHTSEGHGHAYWCIAPGATAEEWKKAQCRLIAYYSGADPAIKNPSRLMRLPGSLHLKAEASLVTFVSNMDVDARVIGLPSIAQVVDGLPVSIGKADKNQGRSSAGAPVAESVLRSALSYLDPGCDRDTYWRIIAGIHAANIRGDQGGVVRAGLACDWARGDLDRLGRYKAGPPSNYLGDDDVLKDFDTSGPRNRGITVGTVFKMARDRKWPGNPFGDGMPASEKFELDPITLNSDDESPDNIFERATPNDIVDVTADMLPDVIASFAEDAAERIGCTISMVAVPALVLASGCLHDGYKLQPREHDTSWKEPARLWSMVIDKPSGAKTPAADAAMNIGRQIDAEWQEKLAADLAQFEREEEQCELERKELAKDPDFASLAPPRPVKPSERRLMANNFTVEGLRGVLAENPAGLCIYVNELAGIFGGLNEYKGGAGSDRQMLVELNDGGSKHIDRAGKRIFIPNWGASVFGTIQPGVLTAIVKNRALAADGLFQRFMPFFGRTLGEGLDRTPNEKAIRRYEDAVRRLTRLPVPVGPPIISTLAPEGRAMWEEISRFRWTSYQQEDDRNIGGYFGKWPKFFGRLIMTFHAIECVAASTFAHDAMITPSVRTETVVKAHRLLMQFFYRQGLLVYGRMFSALELEAQWVGDHILAHGLSTVKLRDLKRVHPAFNKSEALALQAMQHLRERGWVGEPQGSRGGHGALSVLWAVDNRVHTIFAERAAEARTRRGRLGEGIDAA